MSQAILFDFDGVIVDSYDATYKIMHHEDPGLTSDTYKQWFNGNSTKTVKSTLSAAAVKDFFKRYLKQAATLPLVPGMLELIKQQAEEKQLFIVSATDARSIHAFLDEAGLSKCFTEVYGYESGANKTEKILEIRQVYNLGEQDCLFITDTVGDIREGLAAGVATVGVSWGYHTCDELSAAGPINVVHSPAELAREIDYLGK